MKARLLTSLALSIFCLAAYAQDVENDDMYFNAKDRIARKASKGRDEQVYASVKTEKPKTTVEISEDQPLNPTDSYSARNVNPEFAARSNAEIAKTDDDNYFSPDYHYQTRSDLDSWNNSFNSQYGNAWYQNNYWAPGMYSWNSRYYGGGFYDPWANIWYSPYSRPGWNSSLSFSCGNAWNYGYGSAWSMSYGYGYGGYGYGYGNPYNSYWYNPYSYWGGGYPQYVVVERNTHQAYGKRNSRSSSLHPVAGNTGGGRPVFGSTSNGRTATGARMTSNTTRQSGASRQQPTEYYNRSWRNQPATTTSSDSQNSYSNGSSTPTRTTRSSSSSWNNGNDSGGSYSPSRSSGSSGGSYTPSRSSGSSGGSSSGGGSRSSSGGGSSSGGSRSRGR
jgi:hypothetical protein